MTTHATDFLIELSGTPFLKTQEEPVKVRTEEEEEPEKKVHFQIKGSSLLLLDRLDSLSLQDDKESTSGSPSPVAKVPKSYIPSFTTPSISISKEKDDKKFEGSRSNVSASPVNKEVEEARPNIRSSPVLPPRAVLSSPDNDGLIGSRNQLHGDRHPIMKKSNLGENTDSGGKMNTRSLKSKAPLNMKLGSKETVNSKSGLKEKQSPVLTVPKQSGYLRKGRQRSTQISNAAVLSHS